MRTTPVEYDWRRISEFPNIDQPPVPGPRPREMSFRLPGCPPAGGSRAKRLPLAYHDAEGRYADFHALRHSFITMVGRAGVSPREHQDLARHSMYALTSRYSHSRFYDLAAAVQSLLIPTGTSDREAGTLAATGTDGMLPKKPWPATGYFGRQTETDHKPLSKQKPRKITPF